MNCKLCDTYAEVAGYDYFVKALAKHHPHCKEFSHALFVVRAIDLIERLANGIEAWAADEDGVHDAVYDAYREARSVVPKNRRKADT